MWMHRSNVCSLCTHLRKDNGHSLTHPSSTADSCNQPPPLFLPPHRSFFFPDAASRLAKQVVHACLICPVSSFDAGCLPRRSAPSLFPIEQLVLASCQRWFWCLLLQQKRKENKQYEHPWKYIEYVVLLAPSLYFVTCCPWVLPLLVKIPHEQVKASSKFV